MTRQIIVYNQIVDGQPQMHICMPDPNCGIPIQEIARKDVPAGLEYKIIDESELPTDTDFAMAWELTILNPDGVAIGPEAWAAEQRANNEN